MADFSIEKQLISNGYRYIAGIDEAGRGPLAGPVVAAVVIIEQDVELYCKVNDSKKISEKNRELLFDLITDNAISYSVSLIDNNTIDNINILKSTMLAMNNAINNLSLLPDYLLIDGNYFINESVVPYQTIIKGDSISASIASASILAKVTRDRWMVDVAHKEFPEYNFAKHKGYATREHRELIKKYGYCRYHRTTFLANIISEFDNSNNKLF
jgi:ribonuclease HII